MDQDNNLPPYTVRHSRRARRATIRIQPGRGVEVVLPEGVDSRLAPELVRSKRRWIRDWMRRLRIEDTPPAMRQLPDEIALPAVDARFEVHYGTSRDASSSSSSPLSLTKNAGALQFMGKAVSREQHFTLLRSWLKKRGRHWLVPWLRRVSKEQGIPCNGIQLRLQRTRWGSCSGRGTISLNAALLFLPPELVRHVFLHELCHIKHLNHSKDYWCLLQSITPQAMELEKRLDHSWHLLPTWVIPG